MAKGTGSAMQLLKVRNLEALVSEAIVSGNSPSDELLEELEHAQGDELWRRWIEAGGHMGDI